VGRRRIETPRRSLRPIHSKYSPASCLWRVSLGWDGFDGVIDATPFRPGAMASTTPPQPLGPRRQPWTGETSTHLLEARGLSAWGEHLLVRPSEQVGDLERYLDGDPTRRGGDGLAPEQAVEDLGHPWHPALLVAPGPLDQHSQGTRGGRAKPPIRLRANRRVARAGLCAGPGILLIKHSQGPTARCGLVRGCADG
jgi:hypothetical protein